MDDKTQEDRKRTFARSYGYLLRTYPFWMSVFAPALLTILGIAVLSVKPSDGYFTVSLVAALSLYGLVIILKTVLDYMNAQQMMRLSRRSVSLKAQIMHLDNFVKYKARSMTNAAESAENEVELLRRARGKLKFDRSVSIITEQVSKAVISYLRNIGKATDNTHFVCKMLIPDENGDFCAIGDWYITGGTRTPNRNTGLNTSMDNCLASHLWKDRGKTIVSIPDVSIGEEEKNFVFVHDSQRENLKSICCFRISDQNSGQPIALWSIDADQKGIFPENGDEDLMEINRIFSSFSLRVSLEYIYSNILDDTQFVYEAAIEGEVGGNKI